MPTLLLPTKEAARDQGALEREAEEARQGERRAREGERKAKEEVGRLQRVVEEGRRAEQRVKQLEQELQKKNKDIIEREKEKQGLVGKVEEAEAARKSLMKDIESGKHEEKMKEKYEKEKWENLAEISKIKQRNFSLCEEIKAMVATIENLKSQREESNKAKEEVDASVVEKKDRVIANLEKKLQKAYERERAAVAKIKGRKQDKVEVMEEMEVESCEEKEISEEEVEVAEVRRRRSFSFLTPSRGCRFPMFHPKVERRRVARFTKLGALDCLTCTLPSLPRPPSLSDPCPPQPPRGRGEGAAKRQRQASNSPSPKKKAKTTPPSNQHLSPPPSTSSSPSSLSSFILL